MTAPFSTGDKYWLSGQVGKYGGSEPPRVCPILPLYCLVCEMRPTQEDVPAGLCLAHGGASKTWEGHSVREENQSHALLTTEGGKSKRGGTALVTPMGTARTPQGFALLLDPCLVLETSEATLRHRQCRGSEN